MDSAGFFVVHSFILSSPPHTLSLRRPVEKEGISGMILGCLIVVLIVVASSEKAEAIASLNDREDNGL